MFIDLGEHYLDGFISLKDIAERKNLSKKFLEQIVPIYKTVGLLVGNRGNQGGYKLSKDPKNITVKDIIYVLEVDLNKDTINFIPIDKLINKADDMLNEYFMSVSLQDLVEKQKETYSYDYSI